MWIAARYFAAVILRLICQLLPFLNKARLSDIILTTKIEGRLENRADRIFTTCSCQGNHNELLLSQLLWLLVCFWAQSILSVSVSESLNSWGPKYLTDYSLSHINQLKFRGQPREPALADIWSLGTQGMPSPALAFAFGCPPPPERMAASPEGLKPCLSQRNTEWDQ